MVDDDFKWRFSIEPRRDAPVLDDPLAELVRSFLADLLNIAVLLEDGRLVKVDGFAFANDPDRVLPIYPPSDVPSTAKEVRSR